MSTAIVDSTLARVPERYRKTTKQFIKFAITGCIGAVVDFGVYTFLTRSISWNLFYDVMGFKISVANNISVFLAIISNFVLNRWWTFRARYGNVAGQWVGYLGLNTATWAINQILVSYFAWHMPLFTTLFGGQRDLAAKVVAIAFILGFNFLGSKFLIFHRPAVSL